MKRDLNRRAVLWMLTGGVLTQALYGFLRALSVDHDRAFSIAKYAADPAVDVAVNMVVAGVSLVIAGLLWTGRSWVWWLALIVLTVGAIDALHLGEAPYGGTQYWGLLVLRAAVIYLFTTPLVRAIYAIDSGQR